MGQRADEIEGTTDETEDTLVLITPVGSSAVASPPAQDNAEDVETARAQIEETRAEMSETVDAIKEKLSPAHLVQEAKETVREATIGRAEEAVSHAVDSAKETVSHAVDSAKETVGGAVDSAKEMVSQTGHKARGAGSTIVRGIKEHPLLAAVAAISLAGLYLAFRRQRNKTQP